MNLNLTHQLNYILYNVCNSKGHLSHQVFLHSICSIVNFSNAWPKGSQYLLREGSLFIITS